MLLGLRKAVGKRIWQVMRYQALHVCSIDADDLSQCWQTLQLLSGSAADIYHAAEYPTLNQVSQERVDVMLVHGAGQKIQEVNVFRSCGVVARKPSVRKRPVETVCSS